MADEWTIAGKARTDFAEMISGLSADQQTADTLCDGWTVQNVAGHVVSFIEMSLPTLMISMAKGGFNIDKAWHANAKKYGEQGMQEIVRKIQADAAKPSAVKSFPAGLTIADVAVHTQDVRRPLGLGGSLDPQVTRSALDFCTSHKKGKMQVPSDHIGGLCLEAADMDWTWGSGDLVRGPAEAILLAINRRDTRSELTGDGVAKLPRG
ncbi:MAG: hypothetical protein ACI8TP_002695 [Acidimicrobiales bacterium]|jgi:uncharacterized protein (TIGR03083 family)